MTVILKGLTIQALQPLESIIYQPIFEDNRLIRRKRLGKIKYREMTPFLI